MNSKMFAGGCHHGQICIYLPLVIKEMRARSGSINSNDTLATLSNYLPYDYLSMLGPWCWFLQDETA